MADSNETSAIATVKRKAHLTPVMPSNTRFSTVIVPVLSKQHTSTCPAKGIQNGSVQNMAIKTVRQCYPRQGDSYHILKERRERH